MNCILGVIPSKEGKNSLKDRFRALVNSMFLGMLIGMTVDILKIPVPAFFNSAITPLGNCMLPVATLLTGMTIAQIGLKVTLRDRSVYVVSMLRLIGIPSVALILLLFVPMEDGVALCVICSLAMPLGISTIVIPGAYGKDTSVAAGMALVSHPLSCAMIPLIFVEFESGS